MQDKQWIRFLIVWFIHSSLIIYFKTVTFVVLFFIGQQESLTNLSYFGLSAVIPVLFALPLLMLFVDKVYIRKLFAAVLIFQIPLVNAVLFYLLYQQINAVGLYLCIALSSVFFTIENILFEKLTSLSLAKQEIARAVSLNRLANAAGYFLAPLLAVFTYQPKGLMTLVFIGNIIIALYLLAIFLIEKETLVELKTNKGLSLSFFLNHAQTQRERLMHELLLLYAVAFIWLNIVSVVAFPFFKQVLNTETAGFLVTLSGLGIVLVTVYFLFNASYRYKFSSGRLAAAITGICLILLGFVPASPLLYASIMFLGGMFSTWCLTLTQIIAQRSIPLSIMGAFFSLRTWVSTGITAAFYLLIGFGVESLLKPLLFYLAKEFELPSLEEIDNYTILGHLFVISGFMILLSLGIARLKRTSARMT